MHRKKSWLLLSFVFLVLSAQTLWASLTDTQAAPVTSTPFPASVPITAENAKDVAQLTRLGHGWMRRLAWSPDNKTLAVPSSTGVWLYSTDDFKQVPVLLDGYQNLWYSPNGKLIALAEEHNNLEVRDAVANEQRYVINSHDDNIGAAVFSADSRTLAAAGSDGTLRAWDTVTGNPKWATNHAQNVIFSQDGSLFARADGEDIIIGNVETGAVQVKLQEPYHCSYQIKPIISPDNAILACADMLKTILWDTHTGSVIASFEEKDTGGLTSLAFSPNSAVLAVGGGESNGDAYNTRAVNAVWLWEVATAKLLAGLTIQQQRGGYVTGVAFSPDGIQLYSVSKDGTVRVWGIQPR